MAVLGHLEIQTYQREQIDLHKLKESQRYHSISHFEQRGFFEAVHLSFLPFFEMTLFLRWQSLTKINLALLHYIYLSLVLPVACYGNTSLCLYATWKCRSETSSVLVTSVDRTIYYSLLWAERLVAWYYADSSLSASPILTCWFIIQPNTRIK